MHIINWNKVNVHRGWGRLLAWICHPVECYKLDQNCYGTVVYKFDHFLHDGWKKLLPFSKPSRWLCHKLIGNVYDTKILDTFACRTYGKNTTYYYAKSLFGYYKLEQIQYVRNGKNVNTFMDIMVTTLVDEEQGKKNAQQTKTIKKTVVSGWVFTKKQALMLYTNIVLSNCDIFNPKGDNYPEIENGWMMRIVSGMRYLLRTGKLSEYSFINTTRVLNIFTNTNDKIEKLWCYVMELLSNRNDYYGAHEILSDIASICDLYIYYADAKKDPNIDDQYCRFVQQGMLKEAERYINSMIKLHSKSKTLDKLEKAIEALENKYKNEPLKYYKV